MADLDRTLERLGAISRELSEAGKAYPLSDFERAAPVHRVIRAGSGGLLVEGEASLSKTSDVEIVLADLTGSDYPSTFRVTPENGRFRAVVPDGNWGWIRIVRPGLPPVPEVEDPVPLRLGLLSNAVRNCARLEVVGRDPVCGADFGEVSTDPRRCPYSPFLLGIQGKCLGSTGEEEN